MHAATAPIAAPSGVAARPSPGPTAGRIAGAARQLRTARHLSLAQLSARLRFMLLRRLYALSPGRPIQAAQRLAASTPAADPLPALPRDLIGADGDPVLEHRAAALARGRFSYVGREVDYSRGIEWRDPAVSPLWAFNLHYLG